MIHLVNSFNEKKFSIKLKFFLDIHGTIIDDSEYPKVFFLMHKWIMESENLSNMLYDLYKHYGDDYKKAINPHEKQQFKEYQIRVSQAYR